MRHIKKTFTRFTFLIAISALIAPGMSSCGGSKSGDSGNKGGSEHPKDTAKKSASKKSSEHPDKGKSSEHPKKSKDTAKKSSEHPKKSKDTAKKSSEHPKGKKKGAKKSEHPKK